MRHAGVECEYHFGHFGGNQRTVVKEERVWVELYCFARGKGDVRRCVDDMTDWSCVALFARAGFARRRVQQEKDMTLPISYVFLRV